MNATQVLSEQDRRRIEAAVGEAENKTAVEIVCAVATESGRYDQQHKAVLAWPWTINAEGEGKYFPTKAAAIAAARDVSIRRIFACGSVLRSSRAWSAPGTRTSSP